MRDALLQRVGLCFKVMIALASAARAGSSPLSDWAPSREAWQLVLPANSEQRQPFFAGLTPFELMSGAPITGRPRLPIALRDLAQRQAWTVARALRRGGGDLELEAWPVLDEEGRLNWAFARHRAAGHAGWEWIDASKFASRALGDLAVEPLLPARLDPAATGESRLLFQDFLDAGDLYFKPAFGDCVWTDASGETLLAAWQDPSLREWFRDNELARLGPAVCRRIPQPARWNGDALTFVVRVARTGAVTVAPEVEWTAPERLPGPPPGLAVRRIEAWPDTFSRAYRRDVRVLAGLEETEIPVGGRPRTFTRKNSADPAHELEPLADYLEERYHALGVATRRQRFHWRGIPQSNLIGVIPGRLPPGRNVPVLMADHYDTAFSEDLFEARGERVSAPGADDNMTATSGLLRAAETLRGLPLEHDVWLVHLTGEEFPGDDLGARELVARELLREGRRIQGLLLLDMVGWRKRGDPVFQINAGPGPGSATLASVARAAALAEPSSRRLGLVPVIRPAFDPKSYLYNTDGIIFAAAGYPVILFNEHINKLENFGRPHYHQSTDLPRTLDFDYAEAIVKAAIETAARLAMRAP